MKDFCESTSLHGYSHLYVADSIVSKIVWFLVILFTTSLGLFLFVKNTNDYFTARIVTNIETSSANLSVSKLNKIQVNLCQKLLFLHQLTHNMTTGCSLNYKFNTWKFQAQTWEEHVVYKTCFWHSEQYLYTTCSPHVLQKEWLLTKIYLYPKIQFLA